MAARWIVQQCVGTVVDIIYIEDTSILQNTIIPVYPIETSNCQPQILRVTWSSILAKCCHWNLVLRWLGVKSKDRQFGLKLCCILESLKRNMAWLSLLVSQEPLSFKSIAGGLPLDRLTTMIKTIRAKWKGIFKEERKLTRCADITRRIIVNNTYFKRAIQIIYFS